MLGLTVVVQPGPLSAESQLQPAGSHGAMPLLSGASAVLMALSWPRIQFTSSDRSVASVAPNFAPCVARLMLAFLSAWLPVKGMPGYAKVAGQPNGSGQVNIL